MMLVAFYLQIYKKNAAFEFKKTLRFIKEYRYFFIEFFCFFDLFSTTSLNLTIFG